MSASMTERGMGLETEATRDAKGIYRGPTRRFVPGTQNGGRLPKIGKIGKVGGQRDRIVGQIKKQARARAATRARRVARRINRSAK